MAQENEHIRKLVKARDRQVEQRRTIADALAQPYERGETERVRQAFIIQSTIEAIERQSNTKRTSKPNRNWRSRVRLSAAGRPQRNRATAGLHVWVREI